MYIRKRTDQSWVQLRDLRFGVFQKTPVEIYFAITVPKFVGKLPDLDGGYWMLDAGPDSPACPESFRETQWAGIGTGGWEGLIKNFANSFEINAYG